MSCPATLITLGPAGALPALDASKVVEAARTDTDGTLGGAPSFELPRSELPLTQLPSSPPTTIQATATNADLLTPSAVGTGHTLPTQDRMNSRVVAPELAEGARGLHVSPEDWIKYA